MINEEKRFDEELRKPNKPNKPNKFNEDVKEVQREKLKNFILFLKQNKLLTATPTTVIIIVVYFILNNLGYV